LERTKDSLPNPQLRERERERETERERERERERLILFQVLKLNNNQRCQRHSWYPQCHLLVAKHVVNFDDGGLLLSLILFKNIP
jgi:hypothetical protein